MATSVEALAELSSARTLTRAAAALTLARSDDPGALEALRAALTDRKWLAAWKDKPWLIRCEIEPLFRDLATAERTRELFVAMTRLPGFQAQLGGLVDLEDALLRATAWMRPPPKEVIEFWRVHMRPKDNPYVNIMAWALLENGSPEAIGVFGDMLMDRRFSFEDHKSGWLHGQVTFHRCDEHLLEAAFTWLRADSGLGGRLRSALLEALFDPQAARHHPCGPPAKPPAWSHATPAAKAWARKIIARALEGKPSARMRANLERAQEELSGP